MNIKTVCKTFVLYNLSVKLKQQLWFLIRLKIYIFLILMYYRLLLTIVS